MKMLLVVTLVFGFSEPAFAYIDPGTGSILLQGLLVAAAGALAWIRFYWKWISDIVLRLFGRRQSSDKE